MHQLPQINHFRWFYGVQKIKNAPQHIQESCEMADGGRFGSGALCDAFIPGTARLTLCRSICSGTAVSHPFTLLPTVSTLSALDGVEKHVYFHPSSCCFSGERASSETFKQPSQIKIQKKAFRIIAFAWHMPQTGTQTGTDWPHRRISVQTTVHCQPLGLVRYNLISIHRHSFPRKERIDILNLAKRWIFLMFRTAYRELNHCENIILNTWTSKH